MSPVAHPSSFRDPSGQVFTKNGIIYRQINQSYKDDYDKLIASGLHGQLVNLRLLIKSEEVDFPPPWPENAYKVIRPEMIPFISYPYEWSFSQLKAAALTTLEIQRIALEHGLSLKDASAYNIQFLRGRPLLIDTLSFVRYDETEPWVAYRQFCQHFLGPLALMSHKDIRLGGMLRLYIDGIPLDLVNKLLPLKAYTRLSLLLHIRLHARSQRRFSGRPEAVAHNRLKYSRQAMLGLIDNLISTIHGLKWKIEQTEWGDYYQDNNYSSTALESKKQIVSRFLKEVNPGNVWDFGANTGEFSRLSAKRGINTVAFDIDPAAVEMAYLKVAADKEEHLLPLIFDLANPSPDLGWQNRERDSLAKRGPADMALALALIHHLAISNNLPFSRIAEFFREMCRTLVIEFVPKSDSQVKKMLLSRQDIFNKYDREQFEKSFADHFSIENVENIPGSERLLYLMKRK